jgi:hypothetical protein
VLWSRLPARQARCSNGLSLNRHQCVPSAAIHTSAWQGPGLPQRIYWLAAEGLEGQIEIAALRLDGLTDAASAVLYPCLSVPVGTRSLALETTWDLPSLAAGATANIDVTVPGARRGDFANASLDTSSIAFVLDCHVWSNNSVRVTARNVSASTVDLASAALSVQIVKRRLP